jgi:hypothetical protein
MMERSGGLSSRPACRRQQVMASVAGRAGANFALTTLGSSSERRLCETLQVDVAARQRKHRPRRVSRSSWRQSGSAARGSSQAAPHPKGSFQVSLLRAELVYVCLRVCVYVSASKFAESRAGRRPRIPCEWPISTHNGTRAVREPATGGLTWSSSSSRVGGLGFVMQQVCAGRLAAECQLGQEAGGGRISRLPPKRMDFECVSEEYDRPKQRASVSTIGCAAPHLTTGDEKRGEAGGVPLESGGDRCQRGGGHISQKLLR